MIRSLLITMLLLPLLMACGQSTTISHAELRDRIGGGILGQFFGNLNGLVHENEYLEEPGNVQNYRPDLSGGAFTDDDTDIEFVYIYHMLTEHQLFLSYDRITQLWKGNLNTKIWCANRYARNLMELGMKPPLTGSARFNPWSSFNISGQFLSEQFALIAPGMPQTACKLGTHYTRVAVEGEPVQTTQLFDAMIATAFFESDIDALIDAGLAAIDPKSEIHAITRQVRDWHQQHPIDWRNTRERIKNKYWSGTYGGAGGTNGYRPITAATLAALLYGKGDFVETLRLAFNFGWDADNIAAMAGTIVGVIWGEDWIRSQGWPIKDEYRNTRRPNLPTGLTISDFIDLHVRLAAEVIQYSGGSVEGQGHSRHYAFDREQSANLVTLEMFEPKETNQPPLKVEIRDQLKEESSRALAAYTAICLDLHDAVMQEEPELWKDALHDLQKHYDILFGDDQWPLDRRAYFRSVVYEDE